MNADRLLAELDAALSQTLPAVDGRRRLAQAERLPARPARTVSWPEGLADPLGTRLQRAGIAALYTHQAETLEHVWAGRHVVVATGPASGKSLCYQLPIADTLLRDDHATALYLAPTKALAQDQLRALRGLRLTAVRAATYDGDTPRREREAVRRTANVVLTNPDMLHAGILPDHGRWGEFLHRLVLVVVDECHTARGIFGAHVAAVLRRLRRLCARYGAAPTFVLASATIANAGEHAGDLTGLPVHAVVDDGAPRPPVTLATWDPPRLETDWGSRRSVLAETADLLTGLVERRAATLAFVRSRKGAEVVAAQARPTSAQVAAYRAGHLPEERRAVERGLADGSLQGVAATSALELGVDIGGLDAVLIAGWPGTVASLWQQAGRAGRRDREALVVFVADDDPLDRYLLAHPEALWARPVEAAVADLTNPSVLRPHLRCAAWELPLRADEEVFAPADLPSLLAAEEEAGELRERADGQWRRPAQRSRRSPAPAVSLRSAGGAPFAIVEQATGSVIGEVDEVRALRTVHPGARYLHQGRAYAVEELDLERRVALVRPDAGELTTRPRVDTDIAVEAEERCQRWGRCTLRWGRVAVTTQVLGYERRHLPTGKLLGVAELDLPAVDLRTRGWWLTAPTELLAEAGVAAADIPGAAHAAEHAAIGLLPLFTMCDRWDIGGVSTACHPDTELPTIFVYDAYPDGAGITERGFAQGYAHLAATRAAIAACPCEEGCPSCVQSPKCGNGNEPLDKPGAVALLDAVLTEAGDAADLTQPPADATGGSCRR